MKIYLNACNNQVTYNKKKYLLMAAERMGMSDIVLDAAIHQEDKMENILNIEPFINFMRGSNWTGIWEIDVMFDRPQMSLSNWVHCHSVFVSNSNVPKRMKFSGNVVTLFQACDPSLHKKIPHIIPEYDFVLCGSSGTHYKERDKAIRLLINAGFSFCDYGKNHSPSEYVEKINHARVQFIRSAGVFPWTSQVEQRFFECLAIGPVLKDYHKDLHCLGITEGVDYFSYKDDEEMINKMSILLDNPEFAQRMAENGRKKAITYHSYEARLGSIFAQVSQKI